MFANFSAKEKRNYLLLLMATIFHFGSVSFMFLLPRFIRSLGGNENHIGFILGIAIIPALLVSPFGGYLADRMSGKKLAIIGSAITIVSILCFNLITDLSPLIYILRVLHGSGHALFFAVVFSLLSHIVPEKNRAEGIAYFTVAAQIGNSLRSFLAEILINNFGFNSYFFGSFCLGLGTIGAISLTRIIIEELPGEKESYPGVAKDKYFDAILQKKYVGGFILVLILGGGYGTVLQFITPYLDFLYKAALSIRQIPTSLFIPPALITVAVSRFLFSKFTDRLGRNKIILVFFPLFAAAIFFITFIRSEYTALFLAIIYGLAYGFLFPALNAVVLSRAEVRHRGKVSGILVMLFDSAFFGFAFFMGPLAFYGGYFPMFYTLAAIMITGFLLYLILEKIIKSNA